MKASDGMLILDFPGGPAEFELGGAAAKWADRILHPPTRAAKLGIKPGLTVRVVGEFEPDFVAELHGLKAAGPRSEADLVFFAAASAPISHVSPNWPEDSNRTAACGSSTQKASMPSVRSK